MKGAFFVQSMARKRTFTCPNSAWADVKALGIPLSMDGSDNPGGRLDFNHQYWIYIYSCTEYCTDISGKITANAYCFLHSSMGQLFSHWQYDVWLTNTEILQIGHSVIRVVTSLRSSKWGPQQNRRLWYWGWQDLWSHKYLFLHFLFKP